MPRNPQERKKYEQLIGNECRRLLLKTIGYPADILKINLCTMEVRLTNDGGKKIGGDAFLMHRKAGETH